MCHCALIDRFHLLPCLCNPFACFLQRSLFFTLFFSVSSFLESLRSAFSRAHLFYLLLLSSPLLSAICLRCNNSWLEVYEQITNTCTHRTVQMVNNLPNNQTTPSAKHLEWNEQMQRTTNAACIEKSSFHTLPQSHPERALPQVKDLLTCSASLQSQRPLPWYLCAQATEYINECLLSFSLYFLLSFSRPFFLLPACFSLSTFEQLTATLCALWEGVHLQWKSISMSERVTEETPALAMDGDMDGQLICLVILKQVQWPQLIQLTGGNQIYPSLSSTHSLLVWLCVCECENTGALVNRVHWQ